MSDSSQAEVRPEHAVERFLQLLAVGEIDAAADVLGADVVYTNVSLPTIHGRERVRSLARATLGRPAAGFEVYLHGISSRGGTVLTERTDVLTYARCGSSSGSAAASTSRMARSSAGATTSTGWTSVSRPFAACSGCCCRRCGRKRPARAGPGQPDRAAADPCHTRAVGCFTDERSSGLKTRDCADAWSHSRFRGLSTRSHGCYGASLTECPHGS
jgi:limonene-1,2-epoxide hydrolase